MWKSPLMIPKSIKTNFLDFIRGLTCNVENNMGVTIGSSMIKMDLSELSDNYNRITKKEK